VLSGEGRRGKERGRNGALLTEILDPTLHEITHGDAKLYLRGVAFIVVYATSFILSLR